MEAFALWMIGLQLIGVIFAIPTGSVVRIAAELGGIRYELQKLNRTFRDHAKTKEKSE